MLEGFHRRVLGAVPVPVVVVQPDGTIRYANLRARQLLGLTPGRSLPEGYAPPDRETAEAWVAEAAASGSEPCSTLQARLVGPDGTTRTVQASAVNRLDDRTVRGVVVSLVDVTELTAGPAACPEGEVGDPGPSTARARA